MSVAVPGFSGAGAQVQKEGGSNNLLFGIILAKNLHENGKNGLGWRGPSRP